MLEYINIQRSAAKDPLSEYAHILLKEHRLELFYNGVTSDIFNRCLSEIKEMPGVSDDSIALIFSIEGLDTPVSVNAWWPTKPEDKETSRAWTVYDYLRRLLPTQVFSLY